jgi:glycosyltransferase involved in cell wall biosynthesis
VRILFLHPNFPAQFRDPARGLAAMGHEVTFLCQTHYGRTLAGVRRVCLKGKLGHQTLEQNTTNQQQRSQLLADQYRQGMVQLAEQGWVPEVVISHSGWGCGLHVKELWPECRHIAYLEWWFDPQSALLHHDPTNAELGLGPAAAPKFWKRNQSLALELACADALVAPSQWQRSQLPPLLRNRCQVIYDGVDLSRFKPDPSQRSSYPLLTYGTRGMEAMRCFPEFVRELPAALEAWPELKVEIAGEDEINYAGKAPAQGSWKRWAEEGLGPWLALGRVTWVGRLGADAYVAWLQRSWCHTYLTQPFVASWSLTEALACGCRLIASDVAPVREFCQPGFLQAPLVALRGGGSPTGTPGMAQESPAKPTGTSAALLQWARIAGPATGVLGQQVPTAP